jgi:hypothetical protein|tara:strand:+ start:98 stop:391 length:294 start_codon:yes stop_codon:yes gene_type:complete
MISSAGVMHPAQNNINVKSLFIIMINNFSSSAINAITTEGDVVTVEFNGGRQYDYKSADVSGFVNALNTVIKAEESVGRFVNFSIRNKDLETIKVAA